MFDVFKEPDGEIKFERFKLTAESIELATKQLDGWVEDKIIIDYSIFNIEKEYNFNFIYKEKQKEEKER